MKKNLFYFEEIENDNNVDKCMNYAASMHSEEHGICKKGEKCEHEIVINNYFAWEMWKNEKARYLLMHSQNINFQLLNSKQPQGYWKISSIVSTSSLTITIERTKNAKIMETEMINEEHNC